MEREERAGLLTAKANLELTHQRASPKMRPREQGHSPGHLCYSRRRAGALVPMQIPCANPWGTLASGGTRRTGTFAYRFISPALDFL